MHFTVCHHNTAIYFYSSTPLILIFSRTLHKGKKGNRLSKGRWSRGSEDLLVGGLGDTMWEWELEALGEKLFDVWASDALGLLDLDDLEDL